MGESTSTSAADKTAGLTYFLKYDALNKAAGPIVKVNYSQINFQPESNSV